ncbi:MAG: ISKra4 family transposase [Actinobacteria bacterium]|nr:ISKra4 family transposase [Actinomycetota bacterium]
MVEFLRGSEAAGATHEELEARLETVGRELICQLLQDHLDLRAARERRSGGVIDADGVAHNAVEPGHRRALETIFGQVTVTRLAYRAEQTKNLHLQDAALNLPAERHSHGLRERCAIEATRGSFEEAQDAIVRATGQSLGKRQLEQLARRAASDVASFYEQMQRPAADEDDVLVISADGKGIVMRPDGLREATKKAAASATHKLKTRLSKGEKRDRKRIAELAVVYDAAPVVRTPADIMCRGEGGPKPPAPEANAKWLTASVVANVRQVIADAFVEADRRDPQHLRRWVVLVDGAKAQIDAMKAEAKARRVDISIIVDFVHVLEYLWGAAWCFYSEGDPAAEAFVADKALAVLEGKAGIVAGAIGRKATALKLDPSARKKADDCARYLKNKRPYLDYPTALARGWPIATGVIEGAVRHIIRDRFDITGARWSLDGAEAMLQLRAVRANGDWPAYWGYHLAQEHRRVHKSRYAAAVIPNAA